MNSLKSFVSSLVFVLFYFQLNLPSLSFPEVSLVFLLFFSLRMMLFELVCYTLLYELQLFGSFIDKMLKENLELISYLSHRGLAYKHDVQEQLPRADTLFSHFMSSFVKLCNLALIITFFGFVF